MVHSCHREMRNIWTKYCFSLQRLPLLQGREEVVRSPVRRLRIHTDGSRGPEGQSRLGDRRLGLPEGNVQRLFLSLILLLALILCLLRPMEKLLREQVLSGGEGVLQRSPALLFLCFQLALLLMLLLLHLLWFQLRFRLLAGVVMFPENSGSSKPLTVVLLPPTLPCQ